MQSARQRKREKIIHLWSSKLPTNGNWTNIYKVSRIFNNMSKHEKEKCRKERKNAIVNGFKYFKSRSEEFLFLFFSLSLSVKFISDKSNLNNFVFVEFYRKVNVLKAYTYWNICKYVVQRVNEN